MRQTLFLLALILTVATSIPAYAQTTERPGCLETTALFYNCIKGGTEIQRNLGTTYLLGAIQTLSALDLIVLPKDKTMFHYRFGYLDYVETHGSIHDERPGRGVAMYLLEKYGNKNNPEGLEYAREKGLIP